MEASIITEQIKELVAKYSGTSPEQLVLMARKSPDLPLAFVAQQIKGRRRIQKKLPNWFENSDVAFSKTLSLEQCSSEIAALYKSSIVGEGQVAADLTGGFGVDTTYFAKRFGKVFYFEKDVDLAGIAEWNFAQFGLSDRVSTKVGDGVELLDTLEGKLDLIYLDPARRDNRAMKVSAFEDCEPDVVFCWGALLEKAETVVVKASPGLDISMGISQLAGVREVHVVSVRNECKELLFVASKGFAGSPRIHCVDILDEEDKSSFEFSLKDETAAETVLGIPSQFLYEPNASIMKAGAFKSICSKYGVRALNPRTRLYCSSELVEDFPGRIFKILGMGSLSAADAKRLFPKKKANVISRNSGMSAEELKKKLKLKDGGKLFAIGATVSDVGRQLFACELLKK